ncbi:hypothetical protein Ahy_A06g026724 isoform B [Arachis hypogaea]|uniref:Uncharacterized protein n=1 Tax=Arachis hypogaea TaxID=3818 RepID=A0A445CLI0_ARAHY|nr:hypothetical protein Ahy_A06g026724 isoform B [Arachis hypogaea]
MGWDLGIALLAASLFPSQHCLFCLFFLPGITLCSLPPHRSLDHVLAHTSSCLLSCQSPSLQKDYGMRRGSAVEEARRRQSSILPESERPAVYSRVTSCALDHDAECVTEILVRGICRKPNLQQIYVDLLLSEYNPFKIVKDGKLVTYPWDMPPPYPTNSAILSSSASVYVPSKFGLLAENLVQSWTPQYLEWRMKTCHVETGPSNVTEQFVLGYCKSHSLLQEVCQPPCLDLLSEASPVKIKDGNLVASASLEAALNLALENMSLQETPQ